MTTRRTHTVANLADRYAVTQHTVLGWIKSGELKAINVARRPGGRPSWRITSESLEAFEAARTPTPEPKAQTRRRRQQRPSDWIEYYS